MSQTPTRDDRLAAEIEKIREEEAHKRMLNDRTIGGPVAPRPTRDFIEKNVGPLRSETEIRSAAETRIAKAERVARLDALNRDEVERSWGRHRETLAKEKSGKPDVASERLREREPRQQTSMSDRLKEMAKGVSRKRGLGIGDD